MDIKTFVIKAAEFDFKSFGERNTYVIGEDGDTIRVYGEDGQFSTDFSFKEYVEEFGFSNYDFDDEKFV